MDIIPFKAIRPAQDKAGLVTCRPYDEYTAAELASQLDFNPFSFLHVLHPGYVNIHKSDPMTRYGQVAKTFTEFKQQQILIEEATPCYYLYEMQTEAGTFTGFIAAVAVSDYLEGRIKRHEDTLAYRVNQFEEYLNISGFNTEPVLLAYTENTDLEHFIQNKKTQDFLYDFSTPNRDRHRIWKIEDPNEIRELGRLFMALEAVYIADGHHRSASISQLYAHHKTDQPNTSYFMGFLVEEAQVKILEYNRIVKELNQLDPNAFLDQVAKEFHIINRGLEWFKPKQKGEFGMYFQKEFFSLVPKNPSNAIDAQLLYDRLIHPILGIEDLRNDGRIEYIPGNQPITQLIDRVDSYDTGVGFILYPVRFQEIKETADAGAIFPPKSTYILPKMRNGLLTYEL